MASLLAKVGRKRMRDEWSRRARAFVFANPLYYLTLRGRRAARLRARPATPWPGRPEAGEEIVSGTFDLGGQSLAVDNMAALPAQAGERWLTEFHSFGWLDHLRALGGEAARAQGAVCVQRWLDTYGTWSPYAWRADVVASRLCHWLENLAFLEAGLDPERLLASVAVQARHLKRTLRVDVSDHRRIRVLKGVVMCGVCLEGRAADREAALKALEEELARQVNPDGGHVERSPSVQVEVLRDLLDIRSLLVAEKLPVPDWLQAAVDRMVPMLRGFRHGDGRLALFNGAREGRREDVDLTLTQAAAKSRALANAPHTGFQRVGAGRLLVIVDTGPPPLSGFDSQGHAGSLSFELSVGRERVIVNCGAPLRREGPWAAALRSTAAHSTVTVEDVNSSEILADGTIGRRPVEILATRREADGNTLIEASHDGYRQPFGIVHKRSLYVSGDGEDLRGEDTLSGRGSRVFTARFHLHPGVQASVIQSGAAVLLKLPGGQGWQFRATGGTLRLDESVYCGDGEPRRTEQIVVLGRIDGGGAVVKWRFAPVER
jgi:uncharacterized heparinase superfamily protein